MNYLPIYKQGENKQYQLNSNWNNWQLALIQCYDYNRLQPFSFVIEEIGLTVSSFRLYTINSEKLNAAKSYNDFVLLRDAYIDIPTDLIKQNTEIYPGKTLLYFPAKTFISAIPVSYVYEYVIELSDGTVLESEIFSRCAAGTMISASSAVYNCPPTFRILDDYAGSVVTSYQQGENAYIEVSIERIDSSTTVETIETYIIVRFLGNYLDYVLPFVLGDGNEKTIQTETQSVQIAGGQTKIMTFEIPTVTMETGVVSFDIHTDRCEVTQGSFELTGGDKASLELNFQTIVDNSTVEFDVYNATAGAVSRLTFTADSTPTSQFQFDTAETFETKLNNFLTAISSNSLYTVTRASDIVTIQASDYGDQYNFNCEVENVVVVESNSSSTSSGGAGTQQFSFTPTIDNSVWMFDCGAAGGVDKFEVLLNGVKVATSHMTKYQSDGETSTNFGNPGGAYDTGGGFNNKVYSSSDPYSVYYNNPFFVGGNHGVGFGGTVAVNDRVEEFEADTGITGIGLMRDETGTEILNIAIYYSPQRLWVKGVNVGDTLRVDVTGSDVLTGYGFTALEIQSIQNLITFTEIESTI